MNRYLYIVIDKLKNDKHISYHLSQKSAYYEVAKLLDIPFTMRNFNMIVSSGGAKTNKGYYFVLEKDLVKYEPAFINE